MVADPLTRCFWPYRSCPDKGELPFDRLASVVPIVTAQPAITRLGAIDGTPGIVDARPKMMRLVSRRALIRDVVGRAAVGGIGRIYWACWLVQKRLSRPDERLCVCAAAGGVGTGAREVGCEGLTDHVLRALTAVKGQRRTNARMASRSCAVPARR